VKAEGPSTRALLERHGLRAKKSWGQNFLHDQSVVDRIVKSADITPDDVVVEIGAGLGALTRTLAATGARVQAVERDPDLIPVLQQELGGLANVTIIAGDAMAFDFVAAAKQCARPIIVLGNLPYQITSPLLFRAVSASAGGAVIKRAVFMVQREVAERIVAPPGSKIYGRLSVMVQAVAEARIQFHVGSGAFLPPPAVTSTVFALSPRSSRLAGADPALFAAVVRAAFAGRRKMLRRSLEPAFGAPVPAALAAAGIDGTRRAEELSVDDFARLTRALGAAGAVPANAGEDGADHGNEDDA
jgi:16S rRNA (adenine1518-N6/adenine1519-N6)-dimethyltransferase